MDAFELGIRENQSQMLMKAAEKGVASSRKCICKYIRNDPSDNQTIKSLTRVAK
jgi:hypothetical protein